MHDCPHFGTSVILSEGCGAQGNEILGVRQGRMTRGKNDTGWA